MLAAASVLVTPTAITVVEDKSAVVAVRLAKAPTHNVTIKVSCNAQAEAVLATESVTFTPSDWSTPRKITLRGIEDFVKDGTQPAVLTFAAPMSTDSDYAALPATTRQVNVVDSRKTMPILVAPVTLVTSETDGAAKESFWIKLASRPTGNVTIPVASDTPWEAAPTVSSVTFSTDTWNVARRVFVQGVHEELPDGRATYRILTGPAVSSDPRFQGFDPADVTGVNKPAYVIAQYNGTYTGTFTGGSVSGSIDDVTVADGKVALKMTLSSTALGLVDAQVSGSGTISKTGSLTVRTSGDFRGMTLRGRIAMDWNAMSVNGSGTWRLRQASGTWQITRPLAT